MKRKIFMITVAIVFVMVNVQVMAQEKFSLSYKMEKAKTYRYVQDNIIETIQEMGGQEMKMNTDGHTILKYEVEDVTGEGIITVVYSYDTVKFHMKGMGRDTIMNMNNMMNKRIRAEVAKNGKITKETITDTAKASKSAMSMNMFAGAKLAILPDHAVGIGDKWPSVSTDTTNSEMGQLIYKKNFEYTLAGKEKKGTCDCLKIEYKGTLEVTGKMKQMNMDLVMEGSGEVSGTVWFDPARGLLIEDQNNTSLDMTMAVTGQTQMTIPMSQKVKTTQKLFE